MAGTLKSNKSSIPAVAVEKQEPILKRVFNEKRIVGLAGESNSGKSSFLIHCLRDFRKYNKNTPILVYGFEPDLMDKLKSELDLIEICSLDNLVNWNSALIVLDEFQRLGINTSKGKEIAEELFSYIYHSNSRIILSSPSLRSFNSIIGSFVEKWICMSIMLKSLTNGSQLKEIVKSYSGRFKTLGNIKVDKGKALLIADDREIILEFPYNERDDSKKNNIDIFG